MCIEARAQRVWDEAARHVAEGVALQQSLRVRIQPHDLHVCRRLQPARDRGVEDVWGQESLEVKSRGIMPSKWMSW